MLHAPTRRTLMASGASLVLAGCATGQGAAPGLLQSPPAPLPDSHMADLRDPASGHTWRVWVQRPAGPAPRDGYPVVYVLDGNASFALAAQLVRNQTSRPPLLRPDATIVVGIGHPGDATINQPLRARDYTPPTPGASPRGDQGGADRLLDFIQHTLQPYISGAFAVDSQRQTLFGHSFGGLFVLHTLFTRPQLFTRYAAASPSIWWNDAQVLQSCARFESTYAQAPRPFKAQLQMHAGSLENTTAAATAERAATQRARRMLDHTGELATRLQALQWPELVVDFTLLPGLDHGSVMAPALIAGLALASKPRV